MKLISRPYAALNFLLLLLISRWEFTGAYLPIIMLHGIFSDAASMESLGDMIRSAHPGTQVYNIDGFDDKDSMVDMWTQVDDFRKKMMPIFKNSTDGVNMICFSQGGLACRAILQTTPEHNVKTFVSLSSPQGGQYGDTIYLDLLPNITRDVAYLFFYSALGQDMSIGNYWKDPHHVSEYLKHNKFLPKLDTPSNSSDRKNFMKIENLVMIGGPDDGVITPWQSSHFASYNDEDVVLELEKQEFYLNDSFGLKSMNSAGKLHMHVMKGVQHTQWHKNKDVFTNCIEQHLK